MLETTIRTEKTKLSTSHLQQTHAQDDIEDVAGEEGDIEEIVNDEYRGWI